MVVNPWKAFLFLGGVTVAAGGTAYVSGALDPYLHARPGQIAAVPRQDPAPTGAERLPALEQPATPAAPAETQKPAAKAPVAPTFDLVRVEPDGSVVVAGKAEPESSVDMLAGQQVIGTARSDASGDFAIVLDKPLKAGDHQLTLRSTAPGASAVGSVETAVVSVPATPNGQVLAMVETPGKASEVVIAPQPPAQTAADPAKPTEAPKPMEPVQSSQPAPSGETEPGPRAGTPAVAVQAVEIEGRKVFVAGTAEPGRNVRVYANEVLLGEARVGPNGRFLVETERELPVGNYTIRTDVLGGDGLQVIARAAVPFEREPGETIAAVAPTAPGGAPTGDPRPTPSSDAGRAGAAEPTKPSEQAAAPSVMTAPKLESVASAVIIRRGDSLWRISRRVYGRGIRYSTIYLANQDQIENPNRIWPGQVFSVPRRTKEGEAADMKAMGDQVTANPATTAQ